MTSADSLAKRRAALLSVAASAGLTLAKLAVGLAFGSIAVLSEAAHSLLDLGASLITFFALRVSDKPPDLDHPYGHGKIESIAALSETALLLLTAAGIVWEAGSQLLAGRSEVVFSWLSVTVIGGSLVVDMVRASSLRRVARRTGSPALEADALHFTSDIVASIVVMIGLFFVRGGFKLADSIAAIAVAGFVALAAIRLGRRTIDALIDTAPAGIADRVRGIVQRTPLVVEVGRIRTRLSGATVQIDLEAGINRHLPLARMDEVRQNLARRIREAMPSAEVSVSTFPVTLDDESIRERVLMIAAYDGHPIHHITLQQLGGRLAISLDLEVDGRLSLAEAHDQASRLEAAITTDFGGDVDVQTHIEPLMREEPASEPASAKLTQDIEAAIMAIGRDTTGVIDTHDVRVRRDAAGLFISFHCTFARESSVDFVHETASRMEARLRGSFDAYRIVTHAEPTAAP
jgi:cation diffusion facilitator family transporter